METLHLSIQHVDMDAFPIVRHLNELIFGDAKVLARMNREDLTILLAYAETEPIGFKIGYMGTERVFYSAKGGVLPEFRRQGVAKLMLYEMMELVRNKGYEKFVFDTFPNKHPGMTILALKEGFRLISTEFNRGYRDYCLRFEQVL